MTTALDNVILEVMKRKSPLNGYYALRWKILERDGFTCQCCGQKAPTVQLEIDHIKAVEDGGTDDESNLRTTCYACNRGRNALNSMLRRRRYGGSSPSLYSNDYRQQQALAFLADYETGATIREIAQGLDITMAYAYVLLHRLVQKGRIERISSGKYALKQGERVGTMLSKEGLCKK